MLAIWTPTTLSSDSLCSIRRLQFTVIVVLNGNRNRQSERDNEHDRRNGNQPGPLWIVPEISGKARHRSLYDLLTYLATTFKSSKYVTESALVHSPTLPGSLNVSSVASIFLAPS